MSDGTTSDPTSTVKAMTEKKNFESDAVTYGTAADVTNYAKGQAPTQVQNDGTPEPQPGTEGKEEKHPVEKNKVVKGQAPTGTQFDGTPQPQPGTEDIDI